MPPEYFSNSTIDVLKKHNVLFENWGTGASKTVEHLLKEVKEGECKLVVGENGELERHAVAVWVEVFFTSKEGRKFRLEEEKQVFKDGRERTRSHASSVAEKAKVGEDPEKVARRALAEELKIEYGGEIEFDKAQDLTKDSTSYPGLRTHFQEYYYKVNLTEDQFRPEGYIEEQLDKSTFFVWKEIEL